MSTNVEGAVLTPEQQTVVDIVRASMAAGFDQLLAKQAAAVRPEPPAIDQVADALAKAQHDFTNPERDRTVEVSSQRTGAKYTFSYATLGSILTVVRKPLAANGLALVQRITSTDKGMLLVTELLHTSGQRLSTTLPLRDTSSGPQALGSEITYMRRYAISALLCIAGEEDDDGNLSEGNEAEQKPKGSRRKEDRPPAPRPVDNPRKEERQRAKADEQELTWAECEKLLADAGVVAVTTDHPERAQYASWLRHSMEQALGMDVARLANLTPAQLTTGTKKVVALIKDETIRPWKPADAKEA